MKSYLKILTIAILFHSIQLAKADEGMWLPFLINELNYAEMQEMGLKLTPDQMYDINNSSLKDAIVMLDNGSCTGEIISNEGLLLTNHHCGFGEIQAHSTVENDYITDGFVAWERSEELPNPGKTASFLLRIEDVTDQVLKDVTEEMSEAEREENINKAIDNIIVEATSDSYYNATVNAMFEGNEYYLFVYVTYRDVRLVYAPPEAIGSFGGDTDNWMWPRHTGDFTLFRVYTAPNGEPANYAEENVPLKPKHYLPISIEGVKENDFAMIWGYPASTDRYLSSFGVKLALEEFNPDMIALMGKLLEVTKQDMDKSDEVRIKYASKYARIANYWKYLQGQSRGLKRLKVSEKKQKTEEAFNQWANENEDRKSKYGDIIGRLEAGYKAYRENGYDNISLTNRLGALSVEIIRPASAAISLKNQLEAENDISNTVAAIRASMNDHFKDYNLETDKKKLVVILEEYRNKVPKRFQPDVMDLIEKKYKGNIQKYADHVYKKSVFATAERMNDFLDDPSAKVFKKDPAFNMTLSFYEAFEKLENDKSKVDADLNKAKRLFIAGLREMHPDRKFYPDANRTMRVTYGIVDDYYPADAVHYDLMTFLKGVMEKEDPADEEFIVPEKLKKIYQKKNYGRYGMGDKMPVNFLTNNDITGGNSGSPVINANGELIGTAFDGNWEAMSGDIAFEPELQRTIVADIRYVLLIIDQFSGATHLIDELKIVEKSPEPAKAEEVPVEN